MLRHGTSLRCYWDYNRTFQLGPGDRLLIVTPFFHCFGYKAGWMVALMAGAVSVPVAVFDPAAALGMIEELQITHTAARQPCSGRSSTIQADPTEISRVSDGPPPRQPTCHSS